MTEIANKYPDTEGNLYTVTGMIYQNCVTDLAVFAKHKKRYTMSFFDSILKQRDAAEALPNLDQRQSTQDALGNAVARANDDCCDDFRSLLTYINTDSFLEDDVDAMKKMAGNDYYADASKGNWQATRTMNGMMSDFMKKYPTELAKAEMPDTLPQQCSEHAEAFDGAVTDFNNYKNSAPQETAAKVTANNDLYVNLQSVLKDGKYIFRRDAVKRKLYSYGALLDKIRRKKTGYRIALTDIITTKPIDNATISLLQGDGPIAADKKGIILLDITAGDYDYTITAPDYEPVTGVLTVDTGIVHRDYITMKKMAEETAGKEATA